MNQLCERTAASSDDIKKSVIWMQTRVKQSFIVHLLFFCKFYFRNFTVLPKGNKMVGTKLFYVHLELMLTCFKDCLKK